MLCIRSKHVPDRTSATATTSSPTDDTAPDSFASAVSRKIRGSSISIQPLVKGMQDAYEDLHYTFWCCAGFCAVSAECEGEGLRHTVPVYDQEQEECLCQDCDECTRSLTGMPACCSALANLYACVRHYHCVWHSWICVYIGFPECDSQVCGSAQTAQSPTWLLMTQALATQAQP